MAALRVLVMFSLIAVAARASQAEVPSARIFIGAAAAETLLRSSLPVAVPVPTKPASSVFLVDVRFCGVDEKGRARVRAAFTADAPAERVKTFGLADDCAADLDKVATRALADLGADSVAVAAVGLSSSAGSIAPTLDKVAVTARAGSVAPGLRALAMRPPLSAIPLRGLNLDREHSSTLMMNLALEWRRDGIALAAALGGRASAPRGGPDKATDGGIAIEMPLPLANAILDGVSRQNPIRVKVDPEEIALSDLHVARVGPGLVVTARATSVTVGERFDVAVDLGGADLQITDSRVSPVLEDCRTVGMIERLACSTHNAGRGAAALALATALRQQFQGKLVRSLLGTRSLSFDLGGRAVTVTGAFSRLGAREDALSGDVVVATP
jgi:hypothetical protein